MRFKQPRALSGAMVQAELYRLLKRRGFQVYLEYRHWLESWRVCVFDLIVHDDELVHLIVEIKRTNSSRVNGKFRDTKQYKKYASCGVRVIYVTGQDDLHRVAEWIYERFSYLVEAKAGETL